MTIEKSKREYSWQWNKRENVVDESLLFLLLLFLFAYFKEGVFNHVHSYNRSEVLLFLILSLLCPLSMICNTLGYSIRLEGDFVLGKLLFDVHNLLGLFLLYPLLGVP